LSFFSFNTRANRDIVSTVSIKEKVKITENLVNKVFEEILKEQRGYFLKNWISNDS